MSLRIPLTVKRCPEGDYRDRHPDRAILVVEVADSSLTKDRGVKAGIYATAGIREFWLVNLQESVIEVHRRPSAGRYESVERIDADGRIAPDAYPNLRLAAAEILA